MAKLKPPVVIGFFEEPEALLTAAAAARDKGFKFLDAYAPYPVHGLDKALGLRYSWIPYVTLVMGLLGAGLIYLYMYWTTVIDWPVNIGGKPLHSWPAFVPITFEGGVLLGGVSTFLALLIACGLPKRKPFIIDRYLTDNRFAIVIPEEKNRFLGDPLDFLQAQGAIDVRRISA